VIKNTCVVIALGLAMMGCGGSSTPKAGGSSPGSPTLACSPSGTALEIAAKDLVFDKTCLAAPANQAFTIAFTNKDGGTLHNLEILTADPATDSKAKALFTGTQFAGVKTTDYSVTALAAGTYFFHCQVHPNQMHGTFVVA